MRRVVPLVLALLAAGLAVTGGPAMSAEPPSGRRAIIEIGLPPREPAALDSIPHPWPGRALLLSAAATAIPIVVWTRPGQHGEGALLLIAGTEVVAPSLGHLYGGLAPRAFKGMAVRAAAFGLTAYYVTNSTGEFDWGVIGTLLALTAEGVSAVADIVTVTSDVERANRELVRARVGLGLRALPGTGEPAMAVTVRF